MADISTRQMSKAVTYAIAFLLGAVSVFSAWMGFVVFYDAKMGTPFQVGMGIAFWVVALFGVVSAISIVWLDTRLWSKED